jgi:hypothetical protein
MPKNIKAGDVVWHGDPHISYFITKIDAAAKSASVKSTPTSRASVIHHNVKWSELARLDESQNAARIVREATENH